MADDFWLAEQILLKYDVTILNICRKFSHNSDFVDIDDLYQECRVRFYEKWERIKTMRINNMQSFVTTLCKNHCLNYIRDMRSQRPEDMISIEQLIHQEVSDEERNA
jgi:RNA polymerase sigma factor (sigma-70 family)